MGTWGQGRGDMACGDTGHRAWGHCHSGYRDVGMPLLCVWGQCDMGTLLLEVWGRCCCGYRDMGTLLL